MIDGRAALGYDFIEAQPLAARIGRTGPMHLNESRPLLKGILEVLAALRADLDGSLGVTLRELLAEDEVRRTTRRVDRLLRTRRHPQPSRDWPSIPWPPF